MKILFWKLLLHNAKTFWGILLRRLVPGDEKASKEGTLSLSKCIPCAFVVVLKIVILIYTLFLPMTDNQRTRNRGRQKRRNPRFCLDDWSYRGMYRNWTSNISVRNNFNSSLVYTITSIDYEQCSLTSSLPVYFPAIYVT